MKEALGVSIKVTTVGMAAITLWLDQPIAACVFVAAALVIFYSDCK